jgi:hypothetical protein
MEPALWPHLLSAVPVPVRPVLPLRELPQQVRVRTPFMAGWGMKGVVLRPPWGWGGSLRGDSRRPR